MQFSRLCACIEIDLIHLIFFHVILLKATFEETAFFKCLLLIMSPSSACVTEEVVYLLPFHYLMYIKTDVQKSLLGSS